MEYKSKISFYIIFLSSFLTSSCWIIGDDAQKNNPNSDPFYSEASGFDYSRFPLIKPYAAMTINHGIEWNLGIKDDIGFSYHVQNIKKLDVKKKFILVYANDSASINNKKLYEAWFVINTINNDKMSFVTLGEFSNYIKKQGIENPNWREVDILFKEFVDTYCLEWIPGCM